MTSGAVHSQSEVDHISGVSRPREAKTRYIASATLVLLVVALLGSMAAGVPRKVARAVTIYRTEGLEGLSWRITGRPNVEWPVAAAEQWGIDETRIQELDRELRLRNTEAFLIAKSGYLVHESYADGHGANGRYNLAAMAKAVVGSLALAVLLDEGRVRLDGPAAVHIPDWRDDPVRSRITIAHLAGHSSGLDDVVFPPAPAAAAWKHRYYDHPNLRFSMALHETPLLFAPGTDFSYSGIGYYALAYALTSSLTDRDPPDLRSLLSERVMRPLGVPSGAWGISYDQSYTWDGLTLYAVGSGASFTARATARIGQLMLDRGRWNGRQLISGAWIDSLTTPRVRPADHTTPVPGLGWWLNADGHWPSLPRDAFAGVGRDHQVLLIVPSRSVVVVRFGGALSDEPIWEGLEAGLFKPLMLALTDGNAN